MILMDEADAEQLAEILKPVTSSKNRLYTYLSLYKGETAKQISFELDLTRNAVQHYIKDWKENGLITSKGNEYVFTEKGSKLAEFLFELNRSELDTDMVLDGLDPGIPEAAEDLNDSKDN